MYYMVTKWNMEKVENIMRKNSLIFESSSKACYLDAYVEFYGKKAPIQLLTSKGTIKVIRPFVSSYKGIKSYKKLDEVLGRFINSIKEDIWNNMSKSEKLRYLGLGCR